MTDMTDREKLKRLLLERSVRLGDFVLASGAKSDYYVDARRTTMSAEGQRLIGRLGYDAVREAGLEPTHVGGLTMGADPIAYAIAHRSAMEGAPIDGFSVRKEPKGHGTRQQIEGGLRPADRALMVEDTLTTGSSTRRAIDAVRELGATVIGVLTLVDRSEAGAGLYEGEGIVFVSLFTGNELLEAARSEQDR